MQPIKTAASLDGISPRKDGSMSIRFVTQEMNAQEKVTLLNYYQQFGWLLFSPNEAELEVPQEKAIAEYAGKTPGQRLRGVLYNLWKQNGEGEFETYYLRKMEKIINQFKEVLE